MEETLLITNELFNLTNEQHLLTLDFHKKEIDFERDKFFLTMHFSTRLKTKTSV